ncbi:MAG: hypothetical protein ACOYL5_10470 [Phototrophicaceae bacterium]|jgi:hypothetical protein
MPDATYRLTLVLLECLQGQEFDGDEPYLKLNGEVIWAWEHMGRKMHDNLNAKSWTNAFDFRTAHFRTLEGWEPSPVYKAGQFEFTSLSGEVHIELWESDEGELLRGDDDFLGELVVTVDNARMGEQIAVFDQNNALYQLTYRISPE